MAAIGTAGEQKRSSSFGPGLTAKTSLDFIIRSRKYRKHGKSVQDVDVEIRLPGSPKLGVVRVVL